jgi:hypothetical protein
MKKVLSLVAVAFVAIAANAAAELPPAGQIKPAQPIQVQPVSRPAVALLASVPLECSGSGASDVASRKHSIKNTTGHAIPKNTAVHWTASDKGSGQLTLTTDLAPNASVDVLESGQTNGYTCTASFNPGNPDFVVKSVSWSNPTTATIVIENANPWTDAKASVARVQSLRCVSSPVASVDVSVPAIAKGGSATVTANIAEANADYLEATANATKTAPETNSSNNSRRSPEFGSNKSCTPH